MLVKIVRETTLVNHGLLERGQIIESDSKVFTEKTLQRWVKRGIAVEISKRPKTEPKQETKVEIPIDKTVYVTDVVEDTENDEGVEFEEMSFAELRRYAKGNGYENYGKMNRDELIEMLTEKEEVEEKSPFFDGVE